MNIRKRNQSLLSLYCDKFMTHCRTKRILVFLFIWFTMMVCPCDYSLQADVIFVVENTAQNGAYINDLKASYIVPSLK